MANPIWGNPWAQYNSKVLPQNDNENLTIGNYSCWLQLSDKKQEQAELQTRGGSWTLREEENQAPLRRNPVREKQECKKVAGLRRMMRRLGKNSRTPEKRGWAVEVRLRKFKKRGLGLIFLLVYFFRPVCLFATIQILEQLVKYHANIPCVTAHE